MSDNEAFLAFSRPFIQATQSVFETMISTNIKPGKPEFKTGHSALCEITSVIPVSGTYNNDQNYSAQFVISFPKETYLKVASTMLMEEYKEFNEEIEDCVGKEGK